eukprot:6488786-Amphidinium_carterae.1
MLARYYRKQDVHQATLHHCLSICCAIKGRSSPSCRAHLEKLGDDDVGQPRILSTVPLWHHTGTI